MSDEKFMDNKKLTEEITPESLIIEYLNNTSELKNIDSVTEALDIANRVLFLADVTYEVAESISHLIRMWNIMDKDLAPEDRKPIKILINSYGGSIPAGFTIIDAINLSKTPVYTINIGTAYSMGLAILVAGHKRYSYPSATFLFHEGSTDIGGQIDAGKFKNYSKFYEMLLEKLKTHFPANTKITEDLYKEKYRDDWWFFTDEAIKYGFCDTVVKEFI